MRKLLATGLMATAVMVGTPLAAGADSGGVSYSGCMIDVLVNNPTLKNALLDGDDAGAGRLIGLAHAHCKKKATEL